MDNWKWNKKRRTKSSLWNFIENCNIKMTYKVVAYLRLSKEEYSNEKELKDLNRIETMYLDYAEFQAENHNAMSMKNWVEKLNAFLQFNGKEILHNAGKISASVAKKLVYKEYDNLKLNRINYINQTLIIFKMKQ